MKLTKADIDKVRHIEGFPIAKDEDIIALSRPPYYTACPNPFIEDFIREYGTPYDEATDAYHREPFAADVSEGKNDPIYMAHSYHTKVPHKAIMRYILHYTKPGDIVFDGFCGTGMTGVAAQMCGCPDAAFRIKLEQEMKDDYIQWGIRKAIMNDLSPAATFIAYNYNTPVDATEFEREAKRILAECEEECGWVYKTRHVDDKGQTVMGLDGKPMLGRINYTVWSDVFVCPSCSRDIVFYDAAFDASKGVVRDKFICPHCRSSMAKKDCIRSCETYFDTALSETVTMARQVPVFIDYSVGKKHYQKKPQQSDYSILNSISLLQKSFPIDRTPDGIESRRNDISGIMHVHQFYTNRNLYVLSSIFASAFGNPLMMFALTAANIAVSKLYRFRANGKGGNLSGTLYIPSTPQENNVINIVRRKVNDIVTAFRSMRFYKDSCSISTGSTSDIGDITSNSMDYIFTDPPFGGNLNYSELSFLWECWLRVFTCNASEAVINQVQHKGIVEYQKLMEVCFSNYFRVLKPNHWITIEFHNSQNAVWNSISEALSRAGFIVADIRILDKQQQSFKQIMTTTAVKQDLVISAYKPKESFVREFRQHAGDPEMAWEFVRQHLTNVPIAPDGNHDGKIDMVAERCDYLLFDRMVAWHIMNGIPVPMDAHTFYSGLRQRFLQRDGMFFLPDQVNAYDEKRTHMDLDTQQLTYIISDEKNAIAWLNFILAQAPKTYQEISPLYLQELHLSKQEKMPELLDMLKDNFVQDEEGRWYIPDLTNAADLAKLRTKKLLKEFYDSYVPGKGKLKVFRLEAIRAGFDDCWAKRDYKTIIAVGNRLPETVLQEDAALLMYYDNASSRM